MSGLPDRDDHATYTESEVQHIVARKLAAIQLQQLQDGQLALQKELRGEIAEIKASVKELVDAWNSAGTMIRFVKYLAALATAIGVLGVVFKEWLHK